MNYSIVRFGKEYIVRAGEKSVLKIASRRRAARLVVVAAELLDAQPEPQEPSSIEDKLSIARDPSEDS